MGPIDYTSPFANIPAPNVSFGQGYGIGAGIRGDLQAQAQARAQSEAQQRMQADLAALTAKPNPNGADYAGMMAKYPGLSEHLKRAWDTMNTGQQTQTLSLLSQVTSALHSSRPELGVQMLRDRAKLYESSGDKESALSLLSLADQAEKSPEEGRQAALLMASAIPGGDKIISSVTALGQEGRAAGKAPAELRAAEAAATKAETEALFAPKVAQANYESVLAGTANVRDQIQDRAKRYALDVDKFRSELGLKISENAQKFGELPEHVAKDVNAASTEAMAAKQSADRMLLLASQIESASGELGGGVTAKVGELWKKTFGSQNDLTRLRAEFSRIVTPAAMAAYKKVATGSTSDRDIETAMVGVPKDTDSPERMAQFLRGAAKLQAYDVAINNAKAEWLGSVRSLGRARVDVVIDGVQVPAGMTFNQFADAYVTRKVGEISGAGAEAAGADEIQRLMQKYAKKR